MDFKSIIDNFWIIRLWELDLLYLKIDSYSRKRLFYILVF
ncbi:hypothetical protein LEP1GSC018_1848 [Leptospira kirschneri str. 2008720114]|nr:hypothetical protein LEP1GSC018_1848 [Leptospira kirschneri str. 2008720114]